MRRYTLHSSSGIPLALDYDNALNEEQREVVLSPAGPALVLAGAGSGKTRALTYRVARLLETGYAPNEVLLLTFTNRAAKEMLDRASRLAKVDPKRIWGGTFHHVGHMILRDNAETLGFQADFGILDSEDSKDLMATCISECGLAVGQRRFPKADVVHSLYSTTVNVQTPLGEVLARRMPQFLSHEESLARVCRRYVERKRELNLMDFDDLLLQWKALMVMHPKIGVGLAERFRAVLVDEYQDVNRLQADIVKLLAQVHNHLTVVGDDAQSIYSFRGADVDSILRFPEENPGCKVYPLTVNYRSTPQILRLANASIAHNTRQFRKELRPIRGDAELPALVGLADVGQQAEFVAQRLLELRDEGTPLKEMAVLYRAHHNAMEVQMELAKRGIPFQVRSGVRFFEQAHIKDVLAFLRFVDNPRDELAFKRFIRIFPGIGSATTDTLWNELWEAHLQGDNPAIRFARADFSRKVTARSRAGVKKAQRLIENLSVPSLKSAPSQMVFQVMEEGSYREYLRSRFANSQSREEDLEQLGTYAMKFDSLSDFVAEIALAGEIQAEDVEQGEDPDEKVTLSSIHQAKGLEWRAVFLVWAAEGRFPNPRALKDRHGEEEERRLFYVAVTRAKDELYLLYPHFHIERDYSRTILRPTRFVTELPEDEELPLYEKWAIEHGSAPAPVFEPAIEAAKEEAVLEAGPGQGALEGREARGEQGRQADPSEPSEPADLFELSDLSDLKAPEDRDEQDEGVG